jgi:hypothetical protein
MGLAGWIEQSQAMDDKSLLLLERLLAREDSRTSQLRKTLQAQQLHDVREDLLRHVRKAGQSGDLQLIVATERAIVEGDLTRYANSKAMANSLKTALTEISVIERHIGIVDDRARYQFVDQAHSLDRNRKGGLPYDEARQALAGHYARLDNMDKSRLDDDEKQIVDARKSAMFAAGKLYAERQARILGAEHTTDKQQNLPH